MMSWMDFLRLFLITVFFFTVAEAQELCGYYKTPDGCEDDDCTYHARWWYDEVRDEIIFRITADVGGEDRWTGIGFSEDENMPDSDIIVGWMSSTEGAVISDRWAEARAEPLVDGFQSLTGQSMDLDGDRLTFEFARARDTNDDQDLEFGDDNDQCYYFLFPTTGGDADGDTTIFQHEATPVVSDDEICIRSSSCFGTTTVETTTTTTMETTSTTMETTTTTMETTTTTMETTTTTMATTEAETTTTTAAAATTEEDDDDDDGLSTLDKILIGVGVGAALLLLLLTLLLLCCLCSPWGAAGRRSYYDEEDDHKDVGHYHVIGYKYGYPAAIAYDAAQGSRWSYLSHM